MKVLLPLIVCISLVCIIVLVNSMFHEEQLRYRLDEKIQLKGKVKILTQIKYDRHNRSNDMQFDRQTIFVYDTTYHLANVVIYWSAIHDTLRCRYKYGSGLTHPVLFTEMADNKIYKDRRCL